MLRSCRPFALFSSLAICVCLTGMVPSLSAAEALRDVIDRRIGEAWQKRKIEPAAPATDEEFLRRIYLDLTGSIPTYDQALAFLDNTSPTRREQLIDQLLADPAYAVHQARQWDMLFFGRHPPGFYSGSRDGFKDWLAKQFAQNTPYDQIVSAILKAEGNTAENGAPMYLVQYKNEPEDATEKITQTFLGVQLQCARCHDHPYENWSQLDFYGMAAFLARLEVVEVGTTADKQKKVMIAEQSVGDVNFTGPASEAEVGQKGVPVAPKFLLGDALSEPTPPEDAKPLKFASGKVPPAPTFSRKNALAEWVTSRDNPFFAKATANRVWGQFMGRGIVHPIDNMSESNSPTHPELLVELTEQLVDHNFDLKWYIRELVNSQTYQLSSVSEVEAERPLWFERARNRPLSAEELAASWRVAVNYAAVDSKTEEQVEKDEFYPLGNYQMSFFGEPTDGVGDFVGGLSEHLYMNNGGISKLLSNGEGGLLRALAESEEAPEKRVDQLYLSILSRRPTPAEQARFVEHLSGDDSQFELVKEAMWVLMTCSEFRFNH
ncbi:DUF1549 and DUF1553 domain-containing protein [Lignipirellula cremea]|uniref:Cytochrome c domain-containing protein n=1 Tax=Lignipirellula cremea TaxID=2528010 RepID=A0A518E1Q0_9BACT|nr:DUF1549 and DUF1553 domain-containing protein [Lignipirellula cremea]QDU98004.1 hypothetical protein Pla8534_58650 [Lignipirellula cremea]